MCWFLRGALQGKVETDALNAINVKHNCHIWQGTKHDVKMAVLSEMADSPDGYRITDGCCDCESDIGKHNPHAEEVLDLASLISEAGALPGAQTVYLCKTWIGRRNKQERTFKLSEMDLNRFLADLEPNTLYSIACR